MNLRWLWFDDIPPELGLTKAQRRQVRRRVRVHYAPPRSRIFFAMLVVVAIYIGGRLAMSCWVTPLLAPTIAPTVEVVVIPLLPLACWCLVAYMLRQPSLQATRAALLDMGYRLCRHCGYWLRWHDDATTCPECGEHNFDRARKLNLRDLGELEIVATMQQLGYHVCFDCGLLTLDAVDADHPTCPDCGSAHLR